MSKVVIPFRLKRSTNNLLVILKLPPKEVIKRILLKMSLLLIKIQGIEVWKQTYPQIIMEEIKEIIIMEV